jgi:phospholipid/cholesterol/gamma-HCH transport system ATP-binding protein
MEATMIEPEQKAMAGREVVIDMSHVGKAFGNKEVLTDINMKLYRGENLVILGKSGQGKSVNIKLMVGMLRQNAGSIRVFDKEVAELSENELKDLRIRIGFLFQSGALFDSMSVRQNLEYPLTRVLRLQNKTEIADRIAEMLEGVGLLDAIDKMPADLSGGMRKRIGLARTLIMKPEIMLYDEPTTGLDPITSREISELILEMQRKYHTSSVIITHDMACAKITADRVLVMNNGVFVAEGSYEELEATDDGLVQHFFK